MLPVMNDYELFMINTFVRKFVFKYVLQKQNMYYIT